MNKWKMLIFVIENEFYYADKQLYVTIRYHLFSFYFLRNNSLTK